MTHDESRIPAPSGRGVVKGKHQSKPIRPGWFTCLIDALGFLERGFWRMERKLRSLVLPVARTVAAVTNRSRWVDLPHG